MKDKTTTDPAANEIRSFRRSLRSLERGVEAALAMQTECCGVSPAQCHLLLELAFQGEGSIGDFATALEVDPSTLSRTADGLVKAGLLSRADDPANRRRQILALTSQGRDKARTIDGLCDAYYGRILAGLPEDRRPLVMEAVPLLAEALGKSRAGQSCCAGGGQP